MDKAPDAEKEKKTTSGAASLNNAVINLNILREHGKKDLVRVLDSVTVLYLPTN
jgi:hypothetical protein